MSFDAAIIDVDGVLTDTADVHESAWRSLFAPLLEARGQAPFSDADYREHVDGKPRADGLRDFLASRDIELDDDELDALAARKNELFHQRLADDGVRAFPDALVTLRRWRRHGLALASVSSSRNAVRVLEAAGLADLFDAMVDGNDLDDEQLEGKPAPDMFLRAAERLGVDPGRALVLEDATSGVQAGCAGGFARVIGVERHGDADRRAQLRQHGAHEVVARLDELDDVVASGTVAAGELPSALRPGLLDDRLWDRQPAVFLDYDGTLTPIVEDPGAADLAESVRELIRELSTVLPVAVVSGRDLDDVRARVGLDDIWYSGSHGFDLAGPDGERFDVEAGRAARPQLEAAERRLREVAARHDGIVIERKRFAIAAHYRMATREGRAAITRCANDLAYELSALRTHLDLEVIELRPDVDWHKGHAIARLIDALGLPRERTLPIYIGDGQTDEDAFRSLQDDGLGIIVGRPQRPTWAALRVEDVDQVSELLELLVRHGRRDRRDDTWSLRYTGFEPAQQALREALLTLGNGNFATRGAHEEAGADDVHYPGTYLAGGYDRVATVIEGHVVVNEDLINWPNWLPLTFRPAGGTWLSVARDHVVDYETTLDLRRGVLTREMVVRDDAGRQTRLSARRLVSMADPHVAAIQWTLTPLDWEGELEIRGSLDGTVRNDGVERYRALRGDHLVPEQAGLDDAGNLFLVTNTRQSRIRMAQVARTTVAGLETGDGAVQRTVDVVDDRVDETLRVTARRERPLFVEKIVAVHTSRDLAASEALDDARATLRQRARDFASVEAAHARAWRDLWRRAEIQLDAENQDTTRVLLLHIFHLLQVASPHITGRDVGLPARGLHGEAYRGHIFWDELFIFPFLDHRLPELTRALLLYRYRRLDAARSRATEMGLEGACYPWQSGSSGREESQVLHLNPRSGRWLPDASAIQRHINAAIAFNVWRHYEATGDHEFLARYGLEMLVEVARFWASLATWDERCGRYRILGVMGPDEFHTALPGRDEPGLDDNAYTNVMAAWCLRTAARALDLVHTHRRESLMADLGLRRAHVQGWLDIASRLRVVFHDERIISQFDGYADLEEFDWDGYREQYGDIHRLDRILEAEGDTPNRYKASKQADVLMLFYLLQPDELVELLASMGYHFEPDWIADNIAYYGQRTSHGSTLSALVHAWVLARADRSASWHLFQQALRADVDDVQGGTTAEGIHLGAMAGTVDLVQRGYTGASVRDGVLWLEPRLPDELGELTTRFRVRSGWLEVRITHERLEVAFASGWSQLAELGFAGQVHGLPLGERRVFELNPPPSRENE